MLRILPPSTESESLRPRHVFLPCESDAKSYGCDIFHLCTGVICYSVNIARAYTSAGPLSIKAKRCCHMSHHIGLHPAHSTHRVLNRSRIIRSDNWNFRRDGAGTSLERTGIRSDTREPYRQSICEGMGIQARFGTDEACNVEVHVRARCLGEKKTTLA